MTARKPAGDPSERGPSRGPANGGRSNGGSSSGASPRSGASDHDRRRLRATWRVLIAGGVLGVLAAAAAGLAGLPGAVGAAALLLVAALGSAAAALHALVLALIDDAKDRRVWRRRPLVGVGLLLLAGLLLVMAGGALTG